MILGRQAALGCSTFSVTLQLFPVLLEEDLLPKLMN